MPWMWHKPHRCRRCRTEIVEDHDIKSSGYRWQAKSAYLACMAWNCNISTRTEEVAYMTGTYKVRSVFCKTCNNTLGIKYVSADLKVNQKKVGFFLLSQNDLASPLDFGSKVRPLFGSSLKPSGASRGIAAKGTASEIPSEKEGRHQPAWAVLAERAHMPTNLDSLVTAIAESCAPSCLDRSKVEAMLAVSEHADARCRSTTAEALAALLKGFADPRATAPEAQKCPAPPPQLPSTERRQTVVYYGICDLKYDRHRPEGKRLFVLELGNGRNSRFSGFGECIPRSFQRYRLVAQLDRSLLVDNKKMTHDIFVDRGFAHMRPRQVCFPRVYHASLAKHILQGLGLSDAEETKLVVLKLLNRCRGAGVVVTPRADLDKTLRLLLLPPTKKPRFESGSLEDALSLDSASMQEQCRHWWSNECPLFAAERGESSHPICQDGLEYDGTLRVGFVLLRRGKEEELGVDFLGGYWKLPKEPLSSRDARARCVSKARTGTAPVSAGDMLAVCLELQVALPIVFRSESGGTVRSLMRRYTDEPLMFSFALAKHAATMVQLRAQGHARAEAKGHEGTVDLDSWECTPERCLFDTAEIILSDRSHLTDFRKRLEWWDSSARGKVSHITSQRPDLLLFRENLPCQDPATRATASYIERQLGVMDAYVGNWDNALLRFQRALELYRWNATAEYLMGLCHHQKSEHVLAKESFERSVILDPDFKGSYIGLGAAALSLRDWRSAADASVAGLRRHPQAFQCSYNLGLAMAQQWRCGLGQALSASPLVQQEPAAAATLGASASVQAEEKPGGIHGAQSWLLAPMALPQLGAPSGGDPASEGEENQRKELAALARRGVSALQCAKEQKEHPKTKWSAEDDELLGILQELSSRLAVSLCQLEGGVANMAARTGPLAATEVSSKAIAEAADGGAAAVSTTEANPKEQLELYERLCQVLASRSGWTTQHFRP